jgi:hypothetical protein
MIRIRPTQDGTYTIYRDQRAVMCGLTRWPSGRSTTA